MLSNKLGKLEENLDVVENFVKKINAKYIEKKPFDDLPISPKYEKTITNNNIFSPADVTTAVKDIFNLQSSDYVSLLEPLPPFSAENILLPILTSSDQNFHLNLCFSASLNVSKEETIHQHRDSFNSDIIVKKEFLRSVNYRKVIDKIIIDDMNAVFTLNNINNNNFLNLIFSLYFDDILKQVV